MPRKARVKSVNGLYHVILRGANRQVIFHDDKDSMRFLDILKKYKGKTGLKVYAWCLMSNHLHLLLKEGDESLSASMKRIAVSYVSYYNWKYLTTGHLFQDRFKSENVDSRRYFLTVLRYIHQNPVKAGITRRAEEWAWSSYAGYYEKEYYPGELLDRDKVLELFNEDKEIAVLKLKEFNEKENDDSCLEDEDYSRRRIPDDQARAKIEQTLGGIVIAQVKSMQKSEREEVLRRVKTIEGLSQRQAARILGISASLIFKA
jgi:putative transposase